MANHSVHNTRPEANREVAGLALASTGLIRVRHNDNVGLMIPQYEPTTGYLPPGVHDAGWPEVVSCFSGNRHRARLMSGLSAASRNLAAAGCRALLLDGSFVTAKPVPGDYDGAWETEGVDPGRLDPVLLDFRDGARQ